MTFLAQVAIIFGFEADHDRYEAWDYFVSLDANSPREALDVAITISRTVFENSDNLAELGYYAKLVLYAVRSLHNDLEFPRRQSNVADRIAILLKAGCFNRAELNKLFKYENITVPYQIMYIPPASRTPSPRP